MADNTVFQLVYVSSAVEPFTMAQLQELLVVSRRNNRHFGITGMLLYKDGNFMQLLEGDEPAVREIFRRIVSDTRHRDLISLLQAPAPARDFADWSMGFRHLTGVAGAESAGYSAFLDLPLTADSFGDNPSKCQRLLQTFRRSLGRDRRSPGAVRRPVTLRRRAPAAASKPGRRRSGAAHRPARR